MYVESNIIIEVGRQASLFELNYLSEI